MFCKNCGNMLNGNDAFCIKCGIKVENNSNKPKKNSNKIILVVIIIVLLFPLCIMYMGYNYRVNKKVELVSIPYANREIKKNTVITTDMISYMEVPKRYMEGEFYEDVSLIVGKCSNYNSVIAEGSLFYETLIYDCDYKDW